MRKTAKWLMLALPLALNAAVAKADDFYKGKLITFLVGSGEGGSFGIYGQVLAQHMSKHIPGAPKIIVKYYGGQSGGLTLANQMQTATTPDGLTFAMTQQTIVPNQLINPDYAQYDARTWIWIGNMAPIRNMLAVYHTAKAQSVEEAKQHEVIVAPQAQVHRLTFCPICSTNSSARSSKSSPAIKAQPISISQ